MRARTHSGVEQTRRGRQGGGRWTRPSRRGRWGVALAGALLLASGIGHTPPAHAAGGVVGTGTAASCTTAALDAALGGGGTVTFNCGGGPVTITDNLTISQGTTLDGTGQQVTIDGGGTGSVITVNSGVQFAVTNLTLTNGSNTVGGGIDNASGRVTLTNSTVNGNSATAGGGIFNDDGTVTLINSTVSDNSVNGTGGGIFNVSGRVTLTNSTVSGNSAGDLGGGGGIYNVSGTVTLGATILVGNSASSGPDCFGALTSDDYNLIQDTSDCTIAGTTTHDITGQDPHLGPLRNNGGVTFTRADDVNAAQAAVDAIPTSSGLCPSTDQRGFTRPDDAETTCDIGAYESGSGASAPSTGPGPGPSATPELGSGELLATGLLPLGLVILVRRRRARRAVQP